MTAIFAYTGVAGSAPELLLFGIVFGGAGGTAFGAFVYRNDAPRRRRNAAGGGAVIAGSGAGDGAEADPDEGDFGGMFDGWFGGGGGGG